MVTRQTVRRVVRGSVAVILLTVVVSGPALPLVDLTSAPQESGSPFCSPSGDASVTVVEPPNESLVLERQRYGAELYRLPKTPTTVLVEDIEGCPVLAYEIESSEMGFFSRRVFWVENDTRERMTLTLRRGRFSPKDVEGREFNGTLRVILRVDETRTVYQQNVTIRGEE